MIRNHTTAARLHGFDIDTLGLPTADEGVKAVRPR